MEKFGYIYKTIHVESGKIYIGQKKSPKFVKSYKGSGKYITNALNKYGFDAFTTTIIEWCYSQEDLNIKEKYWISYYKELKYDMYNIAPGAVGGDIYHSLSLEDQERFKEKIRKNNCFSTCTPEQRKQWTQKAVDTRRKNGGWVISEKHKELLRQINLGKSVSAETREKLRKANLGKVLSEEHKRKISETNKGRIISEEQREHMSKAQREYFKTHKNPFKGKRHTEETKQIIGKKSKEIVSKLIWVNNGQKCTRIVKDDLQKYVDMGYVLGRLPYKCPTQVGRPLSESHKQKLSEVGKGKKHNRKLTDGEKNKMKLCLRHKVLGSLRLHKNQEIKHVKFEDVNTYLNDGWKLPAGAILVNKNNECLWISKFFLYEYLEKGYRIIKRPNKKGENQFKIFINKNGIIKIIHQNELEYYISQGYKLGRK